MKVEVEGEEDGHHRAHHDPAAHERHHQAHAVERAERRVVPAVEHLVEEGRDEVAVKMGRKAWVKIVGEEGV